MMTDKHRVILDHLEISNQRSENLEDMFMEAECCECFSRAEKYTHQETFPENAVNAKLFPHATNGWEPFARVALMHLDKHLKARGKRFADILDVDIIIHACHNSTHVPHHDYFPCIADCTLKSCQNSLLSYEYCQWRRSSRCYSRV